MKDDKRRKVDINEIPKIVKMCEKGKVSIVKIAAKYGVSRQAIYKILQKNG